MVADKIAHFTVLQTLDQGGRSEVYLAEDPLTKRKVAIKMMGPRILSDAAAVRRFQKEAALAVDLQHPVIVGVFESGTHQGRPYVVMEYVEGQTLTHLLATRGAFKIPDVLRIGAALGDALRYAHLRGLVHREITGSSVMLTADGEVKLLELGLSPGEGKKTVPSSAPPEQAAHFSPEVAGGGVAGPASDIWSLGVLLYECLTGRLPFRSESTPTVLQKILTEAPARPATLRSGTPPELERMILRCLEKEPARRYESAADLVVELCAAGAPKPRALAVSIAEESKPVPVAKPAPPVAAAPPPAVTPPVAAAPPPPPVAPPTVVPPATAPPVVAATPPAAPAPVRTAAPPRVEPAPTPAAPPARGGLLVPLVLAAVVLVLIVAWLVLRR